MPYTEPNDGLTLPSPPSTLLPWQDIRLWDFRNFMFLIWQHLGITPSRPQFAAARRLQCGPKRQWLGMFRGAGKSWMTGAYELHQLYWAPSSNCLSISASKAKADEISIFAQQLILDVPWLAPLRPDTKTQKWATAAWDVGPAGIMQAPSMKSVGITGQYTGSRAHFANLDDVEVPNNSATIEQREKLIAQVRAVEPVMHPGGRQVLLGTPQSAETVYMKLVGFDAWLWPVRYPDAGWMAAHGEKLARELYEDLQADPSLAGQPTNPERFSHELLLEIEASMGRTAFALQFMLDTRQSDALKYPLKVSDAMVLSLDPRKGPSGVAWGREPSLVLHDLPSVGFTGDYFHRPWQISEPATPYQGVVMFIDPSGSGSDELAFATVGALNGTCYAFDVQGLRGGYTEENLEAIAMTAKRFNVGRIKVEDNFGMGMFASLLKPVLGRIHPCTVELVRRTKQKELRIVETLEPVLNQHRLVFCRRVVEADLVRRPEDGEQGLEYSLFYQLTHLTKDRECLSHDDRLDALEGAVSHWVGALGIDQAGARARAEHDETLRQLKQFEEDVNSSLLGQRKRKARGGFLGRIGRKAKKDIRDRRPGYTAPRGPRQVTATLVEAEEDDR